jgi:hypothetical protein
VDHKNAGLNTKKRYVYRSEVEGENIYSIVKSDDAASNVPVPLK